MIREVHGDILATQAVAIVNPVNTKGVSGAGLAKALKQRYPDMFDQYVKACMSGDFRIGCALAHHIGAPGNPQYVVCVPTKREWWNPSQPSYVTAGLIALREKLAELKILSVAIPALGCGLGGLPWSDVRQLVVAVFDGIEGLDVEFYAPIGGSH